MNRFLLLGLALAACGPIAGTETGNPNPRPVSTVTGGFELPSGDMTPPESGTGGSVDVGVTGSPSASGGTRGSIVGVPEPGATPGVSEPGLGNGGMGNVGTPTEPGPDGASPGGTPSVSPGFGAAGAFPGSTPGTPGTGGCQDSECASAAQATIAGLDGPAPAPEAFTSSECNSGVCTCRRPSGEGVVLAATGECVLLGRARSCLIDAGEYSACASEEEDACDASCALAHGRLVDDADATFSAEVVSAVCEQDACRYEVRIDGRCYADATATEVTCSDESSP